MSNKIRMISAVAMAVLSLLVGITVLKMPPEDTTDHIEAAEKKISGLDLMDYYMKKTKSKEEELEHQIQIRLPKGQKEEDIVINNDYIRQLITITIPGIEQDYFYEHPLLGSSNHIDDLTLSSDSGGGIVEITLDAVYEVQQTIKDSWLYLDFIPPQELYDKVIVIDAGHGGGAPGAVKQEIMEKNLNLSMVLKLKELLDGHENWKVYYTRTDDAGPTLDQRVQLANKCNANIFISIHNNSTKDGQMIDYEGTEVMYDEQKENEPMGTKQLSQICLEETVAVTGSRNLGLTRGNSIYIIRKSQVPVALIEVGFMTDIDELTKLNTKEYQGQVAQGIYNGICRALKEGF